MKTSLMKGMDKDEKEQFRADFINGQRFRRRLEKVLNDKIQNEYIQMRDKEVFDTPSWASKQARSLGYCNALAEVIELLNEKSEEK